MVPGAADGFGIAAILTGEASNSEGSALDTDEEVLSDRDIDRTSDETLNEGLCRGRS